MIWNGKHVNAPLRVRYYRSSVQLERRVTMHCVRRRRSSGRGANVWKSEIRDEYSIE